MTEFWKSNERHFCEVCQCWLDAKKNSIRAHEEGKGHKEKFIIYQKKLREGKSSAVAAKTAEEKEWEKIEAAANKAHEADLRAQGIQIPSSASTTAASIPSTATTRPPPPSQPPSSSSSAPKPSLWQATVDPASGATYYFNIQTRETRWTNPDEEEKAKAAAATTVSKNEDKKSRKQKREEYEASNKERAAEQAAKKKQQEEEDAADGAPKSDKEKVTEAKEEEGGEESKSKKQKTESTLAAPPVSEDVDEDTGFGKWGTVEPTAAPSASEIQAAASMPRMSPFGLVQPDKPAAGAASTDPTTAPKRFSNFAADDADEADEDLVVGGVDTAQALRNQFGPSALVATDAKKGYEAGTNLLDDDSNAQTPVAVSFKKKTNRGNQRKPVAASNTEE